MGFVSSDVCRVCLHVNKIEILIIVMFSQNTSQLQRVIRQIRHETVFVSLLRQPFL
jgi:hypothetical protein